MAYAWPLDNVTYDGAMVRSGYAPRGTGVYAMDNHFELTISGNQATIGSGNAWMQLDNIHGITFTIPAPETLAIPSISGTQIARVIFHVETNGPVVNTQFRVGANANAAMPTQTSTVFEISPYYLTYANGMYQIVDTRANQQLCGIMRSEVEEIPGTQEILDNANNMIRTLNGQIEQLRAIINDIEGGNPYMLRSAYDLNGVVNDAGGIVPYVDTQITNSVVPTGFSEIQLTGATAATGTMWYSRVGRIVYMFGTITSTNTTGNVDGLFYGLPRPLSGGIASVRFPTTGGSGKFVELRTDGGLRNYSNSNATVSFSACYFTES